MEPYRSYGRGQCNRPNGFCDHNSRGNNQNSCNSGRSCMPNQQRSSSPCTSAIDSIMSSKSDCDCKDNNPHMHHMPLAMAYVPMQKWSNLYDPETAICEGTAFPELNLIFCGSRGRM